jgi:hypothetical protein
MLGKKRFTYGENQTYLLQPHTFQSGKVPNSPFEDRHTAVKKKKKSTPGRSLLSDACIFTFMWYLGAFPRSQRAGPAASPPREGLDDRCHLP